MKNNPDYDRIPEAQRPHADAFLAVAKPYTATEVARVLTNFQHGVNYMGCGKAHCAASYAEAMAGKRPGLSLAPAALARLTMDKFSELLAAERRRLEEGRASKIRSHQEMLRRLEESSAYRRARQLAADRWEALEKHDLLAALWESGMPVNLTELTAMVDAKLAELRGGA